MLNGRGGVCCVCVPLQPFPGSTYELTDYFMFVKPLGRLRMMKDRSLLQAVSILLSVDKPFTDDEASGRVTDVHP